MTGFKPVTCGIGSNRSPNRDTSFAQLMEYLNTRLLQKYMLFIKIRRCLDSNHGPLTNWVTTTAPMRHLLMHPLMPPEGTGDEIRLIKSRCFVLLLLWLANWRFYHAIAQTVIGELLNHLRYWLPILSFWIPPRIGSGTVDWAIASHIKGPGFETSCGIWNIYLLKCKAQNEEDNFYF